MADAVPVIWINLARAERRRRRMEWALGQGGWVHERLEAVDAADRRHRFRVRADLRRRGSDLPGVRRRSEKAWWRRTSRAELACLASWQAAVARAGALMDESGVDQVLIMEDDVGASLARPDRWPVSLAAFLGHLQSLDSAAEAEASAWAAVQLAPINPRVRRELHGLWRASEGRRLWVPKSSVRSHGNGAVLLHRRAMAWLSADVEGASTAPGVHHLRHPWAIRPVADKWLYGCLPAAGVLVATPSLFCLDAADSDIHADHVARFHAESRRVTLELWAADGREDLLAAQRTWDEIR